MPDSFDYTTGTNSENVRLLQALIDDAPEYTEETNSRNANILKSIINNTEYTDAPQSEIEELLLRLKAKIGGEIEVDELNVTENGTYDAGVNKAYNPVTVELPLDSKTITANGTYTASDDNLAGFNEVTVNVEGYAKKSISNTPTPIATFNASALPMPSLTVGIEAQQAGTGDPSPTNIRPFTGWSAVNVNRSAKNMFKIPSEFVDRTSRGITVSGNSDMTYNVSGLSTNNASINLADNSATSNYYTTQQLSNTIKYPAGTYTISGETNTEEGGFSIIYGTNIGAVYSAEGNGYENIKNKSVTITMATEWYMNPLFSINNNKQVSDNAYLKVQVERGEEATTYEAFSGTTYTTQLKDSQGNPMTCYGGTLSNDNGVQRLDNETKIVVLDGSSDEAWVTAQGAFYTENVFDWDSTTSATNPVCMCNMYTEENAVSSSSQISSRSDFSFFNQTNYKDRLWVKDSRYSTVEDFKTALASQPLQIRYKLATPQQIPQDSLSIATQEGTNNLWADSGDVQSGEYLEAL